MISRAVKKQENTMSFRKAIKGKTHKERSQPRQRARFGLLEKHKDYVQRAQDYHKKEKRIKAFSEKAATRNPDEFYFGMVNEKVIALFLLFSLTIPK